MGSYFEKSFPYAHFHSTSDPFMNYRNVSLCYKKLLSHLILKSTDSDLIYKYFQKINKTFIVSAWPGNFWQKKENLKKYQFWKLSSHFFYDSYNSFTFSLGKVVCFIHWLRRHFLNFCFPWRCLQKKKRHMTNLSKTCNIKRL